MSDLDLTIITYGEESRRAEIALRPKIPPVIRGNISQLNDWAFELIRYLGIDVKHIDNWGCAICAKPARETHYQIASWTHLPQPKINIYVNHLCAAAGGECHKQVIGQSQAMAAMSGMPPPPEAPLPMPSGVEMFPLAGSCAHCLKDETAATTSAISRCSGCKMTSVNCQKNDWNRHKKVCKTVKSIRWAVWPEM
ncbi:hypothetical protein HGRIS_007437 [Hohenbuehelia grisea]|uniref:MYND-type domain-containing protein n=1 Tax=Hohenbuehelia grisea TaxID=104357 RepID=A0ABR3J4S5_9AGAR